jgi:hypothetical protein
MNVVVNVVGKVVVDDMLDCLNVQTTSCNRGGDKNVDPSDLEVLKGSLALVLGPVTMNRLALETLHAEVA